ncbi:MULTISPECIES: LysM peptidoglycan-binding domain-containing protein [Streptomyces]|uniref:LysM peptidoglycan-binding domain-containing protein n=1 Tax=Streptomyces flavotricini TaxID=66888 RepID=A0ABS8E7G4_9ACTN|nr:LysM domain-containing protein [Streptomyces flavotricini]MCC0097101.1 LysM peptidoglycan-binding domain-containing protein [Streptomyces flavotricini]
MGLFDFLKSDKKKHEAAEKAAAAASAGYAAKYTEAVSATKAAAERMAAASRPKPMPHTPTPTSAAHKAVPAAPAPMPMPAAEKRTYTVRSGDSLSSIARLELGNEARWRELYAMNRGVVGSNPELLHPGQVLTLPN